MDGSTTNLWRPEGYVARHELKSAVHSVLSRVSERQKSPASDSSRTLPFYNAALTSPLTSKREDASPTAEENTSPTNEQKQHADQHAGMALERNHAVELSRVLMAKLEQLTGTLRSMKRVNAEQELELRDLRAELAAQGRNQDDNSEGNRGRAFLTQSHEAWLSEARQAQYEWATRQGLREEDWVLLRETADREALIVRGVFDRTVEQLRHIREEAVARVHEEYVHEIEALRETLRTEKLQHMTEMDRLAALHHEQMDELRQEKAAAVHHILEEMKNQPHATARPSSSDSVETYVQKLEASLAEARAAALTARQELKMQSTEAAKKEAQRAREREDVLRANQARAQAAWRKEQQRLSRDLAVLRAEKQKASIKAREDMASIAVEAEVRYYTQWDMVLQLLGERAETSSPTPREHVRAIDLADSWVQENQRRSKSPPRPLSAINRAGVLSPDFPEHSPAPRTLPGSPTPTEAQTPSVVGATRDDVTKEAWDMDRHLQEVQHKQQIEEIRQEAEEAMAHLRMTMESRLSRMQADHEAEMAAARKRWQESAGSQELEGGQARAQELRLAQNHSARLEERLEATQTSLDEARETLRQERADHAAELERLRKDADEKVRQAHLEAIKMSKAASAPWSADGEKVVQQLERQLQKLTEAKTAEQERQTASYHAMQSDFESHIAELRKRIEELEKDLAASREAAGAAERKAQRLETDLEGARRQFEDESASSRREKERLQGIVQRLSEAAESAESEMQAEVDRVKAEETAIAAGAKQQVELAQAQAEKLRAVVANAQRELEQLRKEHRDTKAANHDMTVAAQEARHKVAGLQRALHKTRRELEANREFLVHLMHLCRHDPISATRVIRSRVEDNDRVAAELPSTPEDAQSDARSHSHKERALGRPRTGRGGSVRSIDSPPPPFPKRVSLVGSPVSPLRSESGAKCAQGGAEGNADGRCETPTSNK